MFGNFRNSDWRNGLLRDMKDPTKQLLRTDLAVVIADKFPRSKHHYLVLPVEDIDTIYEVSLGKTGSGSGFFQWPLPAV